jgi:glycopeptide antibiotics resistance protein
MKLSKRSEFILVFIAVFLYGAFAQYRWKVLRFGLDYWHAVACTFVVTLLISPLLWRAVHHIKSYKPLRLDKNGTMTREKWQFFYWMNVILFISYSFLFWQRGLAPDLLSAAAKTFKAMVAVMPFGLLLLKYSKVD